jgi:hypothetical protein
VLVWLLALQRGSESQAANGMVALRRSRIDITMHIRNAALMTRMNLTRPWSLVNVEINRVDYNTTNEPVGVMVLLR